jgi:hypothetical protein
MRLRLIFVVALFCFIAIARANPIDETVIVDTSSLNGASGSLDFNFNPGPLTSQSASLQILNFTSDGSLAGSPQTTGDVSGTLPGTLTFDNGTALNDYFEGFTFGNALSFDMSIYGPALSSPDGTSTSGSAFAFSVFSDPEGTTPALTSDLVDGFALTVSVNLDGTTTMSNFSSQTTVGPAGVSSVPEPSSLVEILLLLGLVSAADVSRCGSKPRHRGATDRGLIVHCPHSHQHQKEAKGACRAKGPRLNSAH